MRLQISTPIETFEEKEVSKIVVEGTNGYFCLLPKHIDFISAIVPGILQYTVGDQDIFVALDEGVLIKKGIDIFISAKNAIKGTELGNLKSEIEKHFDKIEESERKVREMVAKLEIDFARNFLELKNG